MIFIKVIRSIKHRGFVATGRLIKEGIYRNIYRTRVFNLRLTPAERQRQSKEKFKKDIKFSIIIPLYNTKKNFLNDMISSVCGQTYQNWELCLADGSDNNSEDIGTICKDYMAADDRIIYKKLSGNLGIAGNSNECMKIATGDYIALLDHDDILNPSALYEVMKVIDERNSDIIYTDETTFINSRGDSFCPHFKPDFAPDTLRSVNYICHFTTFRRSLLSVDEVVFRKEFEGSQDYDLLLRLTERTSKITHIPKILYYWRSHEASVASSATAKPFAITAAKKAIKEHLERTGLRGDVADAGAPTIYRVRYAIKGQPLISILIPNKDHLGDLKLCIDSIYEKSSYRNFEIIIIENNSVEDETFAYYDSLSSKYGVKIIKWEGKFNYSKVNNYGFEHSNGEYILLLNNDVEVISNDWMQEMLMFAQRGDIGAVGAKLLYHDETIQHAGVIVGLGGVAGHAHKHLLRNDSGYMNRLIYAQNMSAVTGACMLLRRNVYEDVGGLDDGYAVAFGDIDLCMKIRAKGYLILFTPFAECYHHESKSRGRDKNSEDRFSRKWADIVNADDPHWHKQF